MRICVKEMLAYMCILSLLSICACGNREADENVIKLGEADITIRLHAADSLLSGGVDGMVIVTPLLNGLEGPDLNKMDCNGNELTCTVPLCTENAVAFVRVNSGYTGAALLSYYVELSQSQPLIVDVDYVSPDSVKVMFSNHNGINQDGTVCDIGDIEMRFTGVEGMIRCGGLSFTKDDYQDWTRIKSKYDSIYRVMLEYAYDGRTISENVSSWLDNYMKSIFVGNWYLRYKNRAEYTGLESCQEFPLEFYDALNDVDFTSKFLNVGVVAGAYFLMKHILVDLPVAFKPIGEISVDEWKAYAANQLQPVMDEPTPLFLDLL